jgi:ATP-binding cassette subfamily F protein 3
MILGEMEYDSGEIIKPRNYSLGCLPQKIEFVKGSTLEETCLALSASQKDETWRAKSILSGLGFSKTDMDKNPQEFSGGYKIRINLAKLLLSDCDMLLLDEPNNYLDIVAIRWLMDFLKNYKSEIILITHDRNFMDNIITHCAALHRHKIRKVEGSTQKLYLQIEKEEQTYENTRLNAEKKRKQTELFIRRFRAKARLAGLAQSRIKTLEKQETLEKLSKLQNLDFSFSSAPFEAAKMMGVYNLEFGWTKENTLIKNLSFDVLKRERICIIGKNGKGKSTLLKLLAGRLSPNAGAIKTHPELKVSYFVQSDVAQLNPMSSVLGEIMSADSSCSTQRSRDIAGAMMFSEDAALKTISVLSGGERSRVLLGKILVKPCHLLLLDEPTNHLDMQSCDSLIEAIEEFEGSIITVTHNEEVLFNVAEKLIIFDDDKIRFFDGTYRDFLDRGGWSDEKEGGFISAAKKPADQKKRERAGIIQEKSKVLNALKKEIEDIENKISAAELELSQNNEKLIQASIDKNIKVLAELPKINKELQKSIDPLYESLDEKMKIYDREKLYFEEKLSQNL